MPPSEIAVRTNCFLYGQQCRMIDRHTLGFWCWVKMTGLCKYGRGRVVKKLHFCDMDKLKYETNNLHLAMLKNSKIMDIF